MSKAVRAIIFKEDKMLVMQRNKYGSQYYTLVGGQVTEGEELEEALVREVKEETSLDVTAYQLVYTESHPAPYNEQYIYLCEVASTDNLAISEGAEEDRLNKLDMNIHKPLWVEIRNFATLQFRTPQLQTALLKALKDGFPEQPVSL